MVEPKVLFEDEHLLVVDKPSGMVVNRGFASPPAEPGEAAGGVEGATVQDWLEGYLKIRSTKFEARNNIKIQNQNGENSFEFVRRSGVVHRLDKETSGVLVVAKTAEVFQALQKQFKDREVEKVYVALVHGRIEPSEGVIEAPIARNPKNRKRFGVIPGGREAETRYRAISNFRSQISNSDQKFTLLELRPLTGRTHQIRIHLKHIGYPIVGDPLYAGRKTARGDRKWCPRLFLHAKSLTFTHPASGQRMRVEAPMPEELQTVVNNLI